MGKVLETAVAGRLALLAFTVLVLLVRSGAASQSAPAAVSCPAGSSVYTVAHEDDSILFESPALFQDIASGRCVETIFVTAGDNGFGESFWSSRQEGAEAAYAEIAGVPDTWSVSDAGISGHPMPRYTLTGLPTVSLVFMHVPDGDTNGLGFAAYGMQSLQKLWQGTIPTINTVDGSSSYTREDLIDTISTLIQNVGADAVSTQDFVGTYGDGDHSDHHSVAYMTEAAGQEDPTPHSMTSYYDYTISGLPSNLSAADTQAKENAWFANAPYDDQVCQTVNACVGDGTADWWSREYVAATLAQPAPGTSATALSPTSGPTGAAASITAAGFAASHALTVTVGGQSASISSGGTTNSAGNASVSFTVPAGLSAGAQTVVVSDGTSSATSPTDFTVTAGGQNVAPLATVTASSQDTSTGQTADKAVDGSTDGYPGDYSHEWATVGGKAGAWLNLAWSSPQTLTSITLYDRPNSADQITGGTITFSDGTTLTVPALPNSGPALTLTFAAETTTSVRLTITAVSATTFNVGLAEIRVFTGAGGAPSASVSGLAPTSGPTGAAASITAAGFAASHALTVTVGGQSASISSGGTTNSAGNASVSFTVPAGLSAGAQTVVVSDGTSSATSPTDFTVTAGGQNVAPLATVTASSQDTSTGQTADKAVDGSTDGYPGDYSHEWATVGGKAGAWLNLAWSSPQTLTSITLYDRPNNNDQITGGTITFSDGTTLTVPALPNSGTALTLTFAAETTTSVRLTITAVSATTFNVGLAEIRVFTGAGGAPSASVSGLAPTSGPTGAAASITAAGFAASHALTVTVGGQSASISSGGTTNSAGNASVSFTVPAGLSAGAQTVVVSDGTSSATSPTDFTVTAGGQNVAPLATVTASSQDTSTGQTADKAVDGSTDGYPGDYSHEWATVGGKAGAWLNLAWSSPQTLTSITLYDRPNNNDQITGGTITFSDGTTLTVPALPNSGTALTLTFAAETTTSVRLTITAVSATTFNVGLAEIQAFTAAGP